MTRQFSDVDVEIGGRIRRARLMAGMTQEELAGALAVDRTRLSKIEQGRLGLEIGLLLRVAEVIGVPLAQLIPRLGPPYEPASPAPQSWSRAVQRALPLLTASLEARPDLVERVLEFVSLALEEEPAADAESQPPHGVAQGD